MGDPKLLSAEFMERLKAQAIFDNLHCSDAADRARAQFMLDLLDHIRALEARIPARERSAFSRGRFWGVWHPEEDAFAGDAEAARRYPDAPPAPEATP